MDPAKTLNMFVSGVGHVLQVRFCPSMSHDNFTSFLIVLPAICHRSCQERCHMLGAHACIRAPHATMSACVTYFIPLSAAEVAEPAASSGHLWPL